MKIDGAGESKTQHRHILLLIGGDSGCVNETASILEAPTNVKVTRSRNLCRKVYVPAK